MNDEHLDLETLADLDEDLLPPDQTASAGAHVPGCTECRGRQADLRTTRALLSTLPAEAMPADVADRIDAALGAIPRTTIVPLGVRRRGWRSHPTAAGLSAAAAVAALVAALVVGRGDHPPTTDTSGGASTPAGSAPSTALALPAATTTGTNYTDHNMSRSVAALLAPHLEVAQAPAATQPATGAGTSGATAKLVAVPPELTRLFGSAAALTACVRSVEAGGSGPPVTPLAIDFAHYRGAPVVLVVLPGLEAGNVDAWFVGPDCTASDSHLIHYEAVPSSPSAAPSPSAGG